MIVKVINSSGWTLYDGVKKLSHSIVDESCPIGVSSELDDFTNWGTSGVDLGGTKRPSGETAKINMWLTFDNDSIKQVLAYSPVFLLNNEGKTVDRI